MAMHDGLPVSGYHPQSTEAVDLVNENKVMEERLLRHLDALQRTGELDPRWLAIARTGLETAFMALNRAVFKPTRVNIP